MGFTKKELTIIVKELQKLKKVQTAKINNNEIVKNLNEDEFNKMITSLNE
jgi:hypothetical protein